MIEDLLQGLACYGAAEFPLRIGEQMGIRQVQYPNQAPVSFISARFYQPIL